MLITIRHTTKCLSTAVRNARVPAAPPAHLFAFPGRRGGGRARDVAGAAKIPQLEALLLRQQGQLQHIGALLRGAVRFQLHVAAVQTSGSDNKSQKVHR